MKRVIYRLEMAFEVPGKTENLAVHAAGARWGQIEQHLKAVAASVEIKAINVERKAGDIEADGGADGEPEQPAADTE